MSPWQSSGAVAEQPIVTTTRRGDGMATGFEGSCRPIGASRLETFEAWPPGEDGPEVPVVPPLEPPTVIAPGVPEGSAPVPTNDPSAETSSQSSATLSVASACTTSSPAPQEMWSTAPLAASIVSLVDPVAIVFWPAPAVSVVGSEVSSPLKLSLPSPRFTTSFPSPSETQRNFQAWTVVQLPLPSTSTDSADCAESWSWYTPVESETTTLFFSP